jgi:hypothetical protein
MAQSHRRIDSYESACRELHALPFEADAAAPPLTGCLGTTVELENARRVAARGIAHPDTIKAYPLAGLPGRPYVVAEFAGILVLGRDGHRLRPTAGPSPPSYKDRANHQWIYWGDLVAAPAAPLSIGTFALGPWPGGDQALEETATPFHGINSQLLRALSPDMIIRLVIQRLQSLDEWQQYLRDRHGLQPSAEQEHLLEQALARARQPPQRQGSRYPDSHYRDVAILYLNLLNAGHGRRILQQLAQQLNTRRETARDWVHRARELGYLTNSHQGRPGALPGPRLHDSTSDT